MVYILLLAMGTHCTNSKQDAGPGCVHTVTYKEWHAFALLASALGNDVVAVQA